MSGLCQWADGRMSPSADRIQRRSRMLEDRHAKAPVTRGRGVRPTERAAAHSPQFGTYAVWTAGLLAALAVRPVPLHSQPTTRRE
jgi:hypothetical protein